MASRTIELMSSSEPLRHLLIPGALLPLPADQSRPPLPPLPHLEQVLRRLKHADTIECDQFCPCEPAEIATARALGLPAEPGRIPWAALESGTIGTPCAWLMPCHWQLGMDHVLLADPAHLQLTDEASRSLMSAAAPMLSEDGIDVRYERADAWLAKGEVFRDLTTWSMSRAMGHRLTPDLLASTPTPPHAALLRRMQSEVQMLFYTHPVNDARESARQLPINALWIAGAGTLSEALPPKPEVVVENRLVLTEHEQAGASLTKAIEAHHEAWRAIDADAGARLLAELNAGHDVRLTLCGPQRAFGFAPADQGKGLMARISDIFLGNKSALEKSAAGEQHAQTRRSTRGSLFNRQTLNDLVTKL